MRKILIAMITVLSIVVFVPLGILQAQDPQVVDRVIASVDDDIILESEVLQFAQDIILRNRQAYQTKDAVNELKVQILEELIVQKILVSAALEDTNIIVEDREVDQTLDERLNQIIEQIGSEEQLEEYYGKPIRQIRREYRKQIRDGLLADKMRARKSQGISVSRPEIEAFYEKHEAEFPKLPAQVRIAHILFEIKPANEAEIIAKAKADSIFQRLLIGDEFAPLAIEFSDDVATGAKGGLLGTTERGDLVPEYEEVAFGLEEGQISEPIKSRYGYHIIMLNWRRGEKINTSHILISLMPTDNDEIRTVELASDTRQRVVEGEDFGQLASDLSDDDETANIDGDLGWFEIQQMPDDFRMVTESLETGQISEPFKTRFGIHLLKLVEKTDARSISLNEDWERINRMAVNEKQDRIFREWIEEAREEVYIEIFEE